MSNDSSPRLESVADDWERKTAFVPTWGGSTRAVSRKVPRSGSAAAGS